LKPPTDNRFGLAVAMLALALAGGLSLIHISEPTRPY